MLVINWQGCLKGPMIALCDVQHIFLVSIHAFLACMWACESVHVNTVNARVYAPHSFLGRAVRGGSISNSLLSGRHEEILRNFFFAFVESEAWIDE